MLIALLVGTIVGIVLALPPGPVGVAAIRLSLSNGFKPGTYLALGTGLLDFVYCVIAIFATSAAVNTITNFTDEYPYLMLIFQLSVVAVFVILGIINIKSHKNYSEIQSPKESKFITDLKSKGPFLLGIGIALTNMANPTFLPSLGYVTLNVHAWNWIENTALSSLMFAVGFGLGNFIWLYILVRMIVKFKDRMSGNMLLRIRQFAGVTFLGFGTYLGFRVFAAKGAELFRFLFAF